jgi:hypothetical protein
VSGLRQKLDHRHVRRFRQRIDGNVLASPPECLLRIRGSALDEGNEQQKPECTRRLALGRAPFMVPVAVGQLEPLQKLAAKLFRGGAQCFGAHAREPATGETPHLGEVIGKHAERRFLAVSDEHLLAQHPSELGQTPAQCSARIVRSLPEKLAELLARVRATRDGEIAEEGARLLRRRKREGFARANDHEVAE